MISVWYFLALYRSCCLHEVEIIQTFLPCCPLRPLCITFTHQMMHQGKFWHSVSCPRTPDLKTEGVLKHKLCLMVFWRYCYGKKTVSQDSMQYSEVLSTHSDWIACRTTCDNLKEWVLVWLYQSLMLLCVNVGPLLFTTLAQFAEDSFMHSALKVPPWCFSQVEG